ncbi:hypothetical protein [Kaistella antarctica]|uniref:Uncharacterized protein n=1 Tax=Kaistella antarctica TaxID=266748 RepID=A0A448NV02_9FLAO|nr:hypothetical protein [Kaistella antarctica]KEY20326.1 hypothetical protein HY04_03745 [Kaistella antarctica]SEV90973.1 hypothetical protein SAMN05421765_1021 [Kaistella antarctica]VEI01549.1 Uncharacterised protein [Kaistella antarctica]
MKLQVRIKEGVALKVGNEPQSVIVEFVDDKEKQRFEVLFYDLDPFQLGIRLWDIWELTIKWKSEIFTDPKTEVKSYFTHLTCTKAKPIMQMQK